MNALLRTCFIAAAASLPVNAEEAATSGGDAAPEVSTGIPGSISDGTPAPDASEPAKPSFVVKETTIRPLPGRAILFQQVVPPNLPAPPASLPALDVSEPAVQARLTEMQQDHEETHLIFVSATVYDHAKTFIRWWPNGGAGKEISGWSNLDWNQMCGFASYRAADAGGEIREYALLMGIDNVDTLHLSELLAQQGEVYQAPQSPQLPDLAAQGPAFVVTEGDTSDADAMATMTGLHDLYRKEGERLRLAWIGREQAAKEQAEFLRLNPPVPQDTVIHFWPKDSRRHASPATPSAPNP